MRKVAMPRLDKRIPSPFPPQDIQILLTLRPPTHIGARNYAIVLTLRIAACAHPELLLPACGQHRYMRTGLVTVIGKGNKQRQVRVGQGRARPSCACWAIAG